MWKRSFSPGFIAFRDVSPYLCRSRGSVHAGQSTDGDSPMMPLTMFLTSTSVALVAMVRPALVAWCSTRSCRSWAAADLRLTRPPPSRHVSSDSSVGGKVPAGGVLCPWQRLPEAAFRWCRPSWRLAGGASEALLPCLLGIVFIGWRHQRRGVGRCVFGALAASGGERVALEVDVRACGRASVILVGEVPPLSGSLRLGAIGSWRQRERVGATG